MFEKKKKVAWQEKSKWNSNTGCGQVSVCCINWILIGELGKQTSFEGPDTKHGESETERARDSVSTTQSPVYRALFARGRKEEIRREKEREREREREKPRDNWERNKTREVQTEIETVTERERGIERDRERERKRVYLITVWQSHWRPDNSTVITRQGDLPWDGAMGHLSRPSEAGRVWLIAGAGRQTPNVTPRVSTSTYKHTHTHTHILSLTQSLTNKHMCR